MQMKGIIELNLSKYISMCALHSEKVQTCWQKVIVIECFCLVKGFSFFWGIACVIITTYVQLLLQGSSLRYTYIAVV